VLSRLSSVLFISADKRFSVKPLNLLHILILLSLYWLSACSHQADKGDAGKESVDPYAHIPEHLRTGNEGRYNVDQDFEPVLFLNPNTIVDAIPRAEPIKRAGNKNPYRVLGKTYHLLPTAKGYKEQGGASWYGLKFHGHKTSNGETYSIYAMSAAHKTLPIPSYVKVTNLANGKQVVVRVNDRGPFHEGRIIDLSYAAATKLDYIDKGTAQVEVEAIDPATYVHQSDFQSSAVKAAERKPKQNAKKKTKAEENKQAKTALLDKQWFVQVAAYSKLSFAMAHYQKLQKKLASPLRLHEGEDGLFRLQIGPVLQSQTQNLQSQLKQLGYMNTRPVFTR